jgi:two-component system response regulator
VTACGAGLEALVNPGKILLVEDNPDDVALTMRALKSNNITNDVIVAQDGAQALEYLFGSEENPGLDELPAVILLDLKLPKINGMEVLQRIRANERTRLLPVVILTSSDEERDVVEGYSLGANSYVRKPVDFVEFTQAARQLGLYWLLMNRAPPAPRRA